MALTAQAVDEKQFTPTRFKAGYEEEEVDDFLEEVKATLVKLTNENSSLRNQLQNAQAALGSAQQEVQQARTSAEQAQAALTQARAAGGGGAGGGGGAAGGGGQGPAAMRSEPPAPTPTQAAEPPQQQPQESRPSESPAYAPSYSQPSYNQPSYGQSGQAPSAGGSSSSVESGEVVPAGYVRSDTEEMLRRTLILAQRTADEAVREARDEADRLLGDARMRAAATERAAGDRKNSVLGDLEVQRADLESRIEELHAFEREYRTRLKAYLEMQMRDLESSAAASPPALGGRGQTSVENTSRPGITAGETSSSDSPFSAGPGGSPFAEHMGGQSEEQRGN